MTTWSETQPNLVANGTTVLFNQPGTPFNTAGTVFAGNGAAAVWTNDIKN